MKITVFGASGKVGRRIVDEAISRHHRVTAVVRDSSRYNDFPSTVSLRTGNASNANDVIQLSDGQDVVINATRSANNDIEEVITITQAMLNGIRQSNARLLVVGGAASLIVPDSDGRRVIDDSTFLPPSARAIAETSLAQFEECRANTALNWTYLSPPASLVPGQRSGRYRRGNDYLLVDAKGQSTISIEDLALALLDEIEQPSHYQSRFTVAY